MAQVDDFRDSTLTLLTRARAGDDRAMSELFGRYLPALRRWASGRVPRHLRDVSDTSDLVQETLVYVFKKLEGFEHRGEGAFHAYLRQAVLNRIRNEIRNAKTRPAKEALDGALSAPGPSPLEVAIGAEAVGQYEASLGRLSDNDRALVVGRLELGLTYAELAVANGKPSADAARMAATRAIARLIEGMADESGSTP